MAHPPPRYAPGRPLPARPYRLRRGMARPPHGPAPAVPGRPWADPAGLPPARRADFLHGVDLFNAGAWWEAHEAWEGLWAHARRGSALFSLLQGLILLAAALLHAECGHARGAAALRRRAARHLGAALAPPGAAPPLGLDVPALLAHLAAGDAAGGVEGGADAAPVVAPVLRLAPQAEPPAPAGRR
jgi:uncharacterized protein